MIGLIITADDELYGRLAARALAEGYTPERATNVLDGYRRAITGTVDRIVVDMSVHAADTLVETLRSRQVTSAIPLSAVQSHGRLPLELRRLCTDVLETDHL